PIQSISAFALFAQRLTSIKKGYHYRSAIPSHSKSHPRFQLYPPSSQNRPFSLQVYHPPLLFLSRLVLLIPLIAKPADAPSSRQESTAFGCLFASRVPCSREQSRLCGKNPLGRQERFHLIFFD